MRLITFSRVKAYYMMTKSTLEGDMPDRTDWEDKARGIIRAEMARQNVSYSQLVEKLESIGIAEDERNLRNKVSRGKFTAAFMLQCLSAMNAREIRF
jgi:hypothetical protein